MVTDGVDRIREGEKVNPQIQGRQAVKVGG
jgi:hypothetical protein